VTLEGERVGDGRDRVVGEDPSKGEDEEESPAVAIDPAGAEGACVGVHTFMMTVYAELK